MIIGLSHYAFLEGHYAKLHHHQAVEFQCPKTILCVHDEIERFQYLPPRQSTSHLAPKWEHDAREKLRFVHHREDLFYLCQKVAEYPAHVRVDIGSKNSQRSVSLSTRWCCAQTLAVIRPFVSCLRVLGAQRWMLTPTRGEPGEMRTLATSPSAS